MMNEKTENLDLSQFNGNTGTLTVAPLGSNFDIHESDSGGGVIRIAVIHQRPLLNKEGVENRANLFAAAPAILKRARELEAEVEKLRAVETDFKAMMKVNKGLTDTVMAAAAHAANLARVLEHLDGVVTILHQDSCFGESKEDGERSVAEDIFKQLNIVQGQVLTALSAWRKDTSEKKPL